MAETIEKIKQFLQTKRGKTIAIASAGGLAVFVILIVVAVVILSSGMGEPIVSGTGAITTTSTGAPSPSTAETQEATTTVQGPTISQDYEVYEYKDPFQPLISRTEEATEGASTQDKNMLLDITTDANGVLYASVRYNGRTYDVKAGDVLDGSPYKVLVVDPDRVVFLYGDNQITLSIGEELTERIGGSGK